MPVFEITAIPMTDSVDWDPCFEVFRDAHLGRRYLAGDRQIPSMRPALGAAGPSGEEMFQSASSMFVVLSIVRLRSYPGLRHADATSVPLANEM